MSPQDIAAGKKLYPNQSTVNKYISPEASDAAMARNSGRRMDGRAMPIRNSAPNIIIKPNAGIVNPESQQQQTSSMPQNVSAQL